jgi:S-adenosylmethionine:tRNA ribosyltransferase-isomerase
MRTDLFDYTLPPERIAQSSVAPRDHSKLLVLDRTTGAWTHHHFYDLGTFLRPGDLLVVNESKVFKARLPCRIVPLLHGSIVRVPNNGTMEPWSNELFLLRPTQGTQWLALAKPAKKLSVGSTMQLPENRTVTVLEKRSDGTIVVDFGISPDEVLRWTDRVGSVPIPPYVQPSPEASSTYQTVYAKTIGSVAAPTAGFHFTPELITQLKESRIGFAQVTLHVGLGTFRPIQTNTLEEHVMHEEWVHVPEATRDTIRETRARGGRVIAVGTTTVRALESNADEGLTNLFIKPGYRFRSIDGLITNFHLPKSSLLVLVSAFIGQGRADADWGRMTLLNAYEDAIKNDYRFYSFGDAMIIL